ncbi:hypothetical protein SBT20_27970 [Klebsiella pneumoniae]|uniref:hypothetical protein n=1 Tax=Klebsiella pneumoniae TaxID=573 RepID=UPI00298CB126|nr:hypothetical protein [Klebsiella pneumoniae]MDW5652062.1 hypothetical protein [Klebsiella pneumoniae]MDW5728495.1 hypothetical protein [Klebsiella pneumoniae]MDW5739480.1 hypothetical protein [Klebsiella pneumoniae]MDW5744976.1 hypothetical protein [Klebsiella pneumoniae]
MADHVTPNLPSRDFDVTEAFYAKLGFATSWKDRGWMIHQEEISLRDTATTGRIG